MCWLVNKLLKIVMLAYIIYFFLLEAFFSISRLKSPVIRTFSIPLSKAMPIESSIEARIAAAELGGL